MSLKALGICKTKKYGIWSRTKETKETLKRERVKQNNTVTANKKHNNCIFFKLSY